MPGISSSKTSVPFFKGRTISYYQTWDGITYLVLSDGTTTIRRGIRDGYFVTDVTITALGFDGTEGIDWENVEAEALYWTTEKIAEVFEDLYHIVPGSYTNGDHILSMRSGSTAFLTVIDATSGAETFQCPDNATYQTADTDYIWFKTDASIRTITTAELIGYDLQRTPVQYDDNAPNSLRYIGILKTGVVISGELRDQLFSFFKLSILWDNDVNIYGHIKSNRVGQQLWTPEVVELYLLANAAADPAGMEANATTGWASYGLVGTGSNVFTSQSAIKSDGSYALFGDAAPTPTSLARFYLDLNQLSLTDGVTYTLKFKARHTGVRTSTNTALWDIGLGNSTSSVLVSIAPINFGDIVFVEYTADFVAGADNRYFIARENNAQNDGGVYIDNISIIPT